MLFNKMMEFQFENNFTVIVNKIYSGTPQLHIAESQC